MHWKGQTEEERKAQITGFSVVHGHVGYLREAYHGAPYATKVLLKPVDDERVKQVDQDGNEFSFPAAVLRERLPDTLIAVFERQKVVYAESPDADITKEVVQSFTNFVELAERKEKETGEPVTIEVSA